MFYELGILADNTTAGSLLKPSTPGSITLDWGSSLGISSYEVAWGSIGSAQIASWTLADNLTDIYASLKDRISLGPLLTAARNASETTRSEVLSLLAGDLAERKSAAYTRSSGQMSKVRTSMWLVVRALKDAIEELVPGLRPAEVMEESEVRWVTLDLPTAAVNARKLLGEHRADGEGPPGARPAVARGARPPAQLGAPAARLRRVSPRRAHKRPTCSTASVARTCCGAPRRRAQTIRAQLYTHTSASLL